MQNTPLGLIPEGWSARPLGDLCEIHGRIGFRGYTKADLVRKGEGAITFSPSDIDNQRISYKDCDYISWAKYAESPEIQVKEGDILFCKTASIGKCAQIWDLKEKATINPQFVLLNDFKCNSSLLYYMLAFSSFQNRVLVITGGSTIPTISQEAMKKQLIPIPDDPDEQKRIADTLLSIDKILGALDEAIAKKRQIKEGLMQQLLTGKTRLPGFPDVWKEYSLGEFCQIIMGQSPSSSYYNSRGEGLPLIQGNADLNNRRSFIRMYTSMITKVCEEGDIIMSVRAPVGAVGKASYKSCLGRGVCAMKASSDFLYHYLVYNENNWGQFSKGSTFDSINGDDLKSVALFAPQSIEEQNEIASILSKCEAEVGALENQRAKYILIKQGMMQQLLTGKTRL